MTAVGVSAPTTQGAAKTSSPRWIPLTGVLFAVLLATVVFILGGMPDTNNAAKVQAWDIKHTGLVNGAFVLTTAAVIIGLFFLTWLHSHLARGGGWLGRLFLVGAAMFGLAGTLGAGVEAVIGSDAKHLSTDSLQLMDSLQQNLNFPMTCAGLALMYLAAGFLVRRTGLLPGWLSWVSWVFALTAASVILGFIPLVGTALWVIFVGIYLTARPPAEG